MSPIQFIFPMASYATRCKEDAIDRLPLSSMPRSASASKSMNHFVRLILIITCQSNRVRFTSWWGVSRISALVARWTCSARNYSVYNRRLLWGCSCTPAHAHARAVSLTWHKLKDVHSCHTLCSTRDSFASSCRNVCLLANLEWNTPLWNTVLYAYTLLAGLIHIEWIYNDPPLLTIPNEMRVQSSPRVLYSGLLWIFITVDYHPKSH